MNIPTFVSWCNEQGVETSASVDQTPYAGYGLFSTETIDSDLSTVIAHIPNSLLLTSSNAIKVHSDFSTPLLNLISVKYDTNKDLEEAALSDKNERLVLCLFLIYCKFYNADTFWKPYIDILPTIDYFRDNHVMFRPELIAGTSLEKSTRAKLSTLRRELNEIATEDWLTEINMEMYIWADCIFWSRVVGIGGQNNSSQMALIPFFDFANHSAEESNIRWQLTEDGIDLVTTGRMIVKGQELSLSYGSKSNQELLFLHGFCIPDNTEPSRVNVSLLPFLDPEESSDNLLKIQWLQQTGVKPSLTLIRSHNDESLFPGWTTDSITAMYLVALDEDNEMKFTVDDELQISNETINSLQGLKIKVEKLKLFPLIQLRVAILLLDALEFSASVIGQTEQQEESSLWKHALIYRQGEAETLQAAIHSLSLTRDQLMQDPIVIQFLQQ